MIRTESHWGRGKFAIDPVLVALHHPRVLLVGASHQTGQPAPLNLDTLGVTIGRTPGPLHGLDHNDDRAVTPTMYQNSLTARATANSSATNCNTAGW